MSLEEDAPLALFDCILEDLSSASTSSSISPIADVVPLSLVDSVTPTTTTSDQAQDLLSATLHQTGILPKGETSQVRQILWGFFGCRPNLRMGEGASEPNKD